MEQGKEPHPPSEFYAFSPSGNLGALNQNFGWGEGQGFDWSRSFNLNVN